MTIETDIFTTRPAVYIREIMTRWAGHWWWAVALPFAASLIAGLWHPAFLFVAFIWLFLIFPPVLMMVYIVYGMRPEVQHVVLPHRVVITGEAMTIEFTADDDHPVPLPPREIPFSEIGFVTVSRGNIIVTTTNSRYDLAIIPLDALPPAARHDMLKRFFSL